MISTMFQHRGSGHMYLVAIAGSARRNGNSERLLDLFIDEFISNASDWHVEKLVLIDGGKVKDKEIMGTGVLKGLDIHRYPNSETSTDERVWNINPCLGCDFCVSGKCVQEDSMVEMYEKLKVADVVVLSSPVYFYGVPSHVKAIIDRCQLFYNKKYTRKERWRDRPGTGVLLCCGATRGDSLFTGISASARFWYDAIDFEYAGKVLVRGVDKPTAIDGRKEALEETRALARSIAERYR